MKRRESASADFVIVARGLIPALKGPAERSALVFFLIRCYLTAGKSEVRVAEEMIGCFKFSR